MSRREYRIKPVANPAPGSYDAVILAVAHNQFREIGIQGIRRLCNANGVVYDVKSLFPPDTVDGRL